MFKKILIANRGEIALRVIRTCKEMGIQTVAVYSTADAESIHVKFADEAVCIGPAPSSESYLRISNIIAAAEITNADAIHPGYGFLSENAKFSKICEEHNIKFIGASPEMINKMGDKATAKATMIEAGVPCVPGSQGIIESFDHCKKLAKEVGYPVMLKASAGGGGKGMRAVWKKEDLEDAWNSARVESKAAFANDDMYMEKLIEEPRHIEIQIVGDSKGKACHLSERDCSIQRRHQKLTEEVPSPFMTDKLREKMGAAAVKAAEYIKYEGVGTVEFLVDKNRKFYFMEMNTRIQVEHPVTEMITGFDIVKAQIKIALGINYDLEQSKVNFKGHAIECRINAEDPETFQPCPGLITKMHTAGGFGIRYDSHIYSGYNVTPYYDSLLAKIITQANSRGSSIKRMLSALDEFFVEGIKTNQPLHQKILNDDVYVNNMHTINYLENEFNNNEL